jgi:hypothetical protein
VFRAVNDQSCSEQTRYPQGGVIIQLIYEVMHNPPAADLGSEEYSTNNALRSILCEHCDREVSELQLNASVEVPYIRFSRLA